MGSTSSAKTDMKEMERTCCSTLCSRTRVIKTSVSVATSIPKWVDMHGTHHKGISGSLLLVQGITKLGARWRWQYKNRRMSKSFVIASRNKRKSFSSINRARMTMRRQASLRADRLDSSHWQGTRTAQRCTRLWVSKNLWSNWDKQTSRQWTKTQKIWNRWTSQSASIGNA